MKLVVSNLSCLPCVSVLLSVLLHCSVCDSLIIGPVCTFVVSAGCLDGCHLLTHRIYASIFYSWGQNSGKTFRFSKCASLWHDGFIILWNNLCSGVLFLCFALTLLQWFPSVSAFIFIVTSCPTRMCVIAIWPGWVNGLRRPGWSVETLAVRNQPSWRRSPSRMWLPQTSHAMVSLSLALLLLRLPVLPHKTLQRENLKSCRKCIELWIAFTTTVEYQDTRKVTAWFLKPNDMCHSASVCPVQIRARSSDWKAN